MKRFWTDVAIDADRVVTLDGKPVRTPGRRPLALPSDALAEAVAAYDDFRLAGLSPVVTLTGSLVIGLALIEGEIDADAAWAAAGIDEDWSVEMWGEDWQAAELRALKRKEFGVGVAFLGLL